MKYLLSTCLLALVLLATGLHAATFSLPGDAGSSGTPFANCTASGDDVTCSGNIAIGNNDDLLLSQDVNLTIAGDFSIGNGTEINPDDLFSFNISVGGNFSAGNTLSFNANLEANGDINLGNSAQVNGDLEAGGNINAGNNTRIDGNLTAGGDINLGNDSEVTGQCSASGGNFAAYCDGGDPPPPACDANSGQPWADINWEFRKCFVIDAEQVEAALEGFPFLVSIDDGQINAAAQASGADIFFTDSDGNRLAHEIERYDNGELKAWVRAVALSDTDETLFYLYYGNDSAPDQQDIAGTWDDDYRLVQHLQEPGGNSTALRDSTAFGHDGTVTGGGRAPDYLAAGMVNGARTHDGAAAPGDGARPALQFPYGAGMSDLRDALTAEVWARVEPDQPSPNHNPIFWQGERIGWGANFLFRIAVRSNSEITWGVTCDNQEAWFDTANPATGAWAHYAITFDGDRIQPYINGQEATVTSGSSRLNNCSGRRLNLDTDWPAKSFHAQQQGSNQTYFRGDVDELRLSSTAREPGWLRTHVNNVQTPDKFHFFGPQETAPDAAATCFADTFNRAELGGDWVTSSSLGSFVPQIVEVAGSGRLRMTEAANNQATAATLQRLIPAEGNRVELTFDYFAYDGTGADGLTIVLSDAEVTPQPGGYGGSLGYANRSGINGFAGGWLGIGLDEFGNYSNSNEGRNGGPGFRADAVAVRGAGEGQNGYEYLTGTDSLTPGVDDTGELTPHRYRIVINSRTAGTAVLRIERDTGAGFQTLIEDFDVLNDVSPGFQQSPVPNNLLLSLTGSTGGSNNIHEFGDFEICADELNPIDLQIDHFEFEFPTSEGLTCEALPVEIRACLDEDCNDPLGQTFDATLAPTEGWAGGHEIDNFSSGDQLDFLPPTAGTYSLDVSGSSPPTRPLATPRCFVNGVELPDCDITFSDAGFQFFASADATTPIGLADLVAGTPGDLLYARPVTTDPETGVCSAVFSPAETVAVETGTVCDNPALCSDGYQVDWIDTDGVTTALPNPENPVGGETLRAVDWNVDDNATTAFRLQSPDVGLQTLTLRYVPEDIDGEPAPDNAITGSFQIRSRPAEIRLVATRTESGTVNPEAASADGPVFAIAGEPFTTEIMALDSAGQITPGFSAIDGLFDVYWDDSDVLQPAGGGGTLSAQGSSFTQASHWEAVAGDPGVIAMTATAPRLRFDEVGIVAARARIDAFLGGVDLTSPARNLGRFVPAEFAVSALDGAILSPNSGSFIYQGQPFTLDPNDPLGVTLAPHGWRADPDVPFSGAVTENYRDDFATLASAGSGTADLSRASTAGGDMTPASPGMNYEPDPDDPWLTRLVMDPDTVLRVAKLVDPIAAEQAPEVLALHLMLAVDALQDGDGVCHTDAAGDCQPFLLDNLNPDNLSLLLGRLRLRSAQGPVDRTLRLPLSAEYWDGTAFQPHTSAQSADTDVSGILPDLAADQFEALDAEGNSIAAVAASLPDELIDGAAVLAVDYSDSLPLRARIRGSGIPLYLQHPWPYGLDDSLDVDDKGQLSGPQATASFGVYEGRPPLLFMLPQGR